MNSSEIIKALREKYPLPEWANFPELRDGTGFAALRTIDFWAMNVFPSKGFLTVAVEVKVSRGDFIRELNNPKKRESAESIARETYFATPKGLIKPEEVPVGWGLIEVSDAGARTKVRAKQREKPVFDEYFIASLLRRCESTQRRRDDEIIELHKTLNDLESHIAERVQKALDRERPTVESDIRRKVTDELFGEGLSKLQPLIHREFPYEHPRRSIAAYVLELTERSLEGRLKVLGYSDFKHDIDAGLAALEQLKRRFEEGGKSV